MVGVLFETLFFYSFLRQLFEFSFGIIPALLLTSTFYSLHHIGLEEQMKGTSPKKELMKLFFVGLMYSVTFRVFNSALAVFPFFIGVSVVCRKANSNSLLENGFVVAVANNYGCNTLNLSIDRGFLFNGI
jgi:membrane protease YdiL (CAAX protease family)